MLSNNGQLEGQASHTQNVIQGQLANLKTESQSSQPIMSEGQPQGQPPFSAPPLNLQYQQHTSDKMVPMPILYPPQGPKQIQYPKVEEGL